MDLKETSFYILCFIALLKSLFLITHIVLSFNLFYYFSFIFLFQFGDSRINSRLDTQAILTAATLPPKGVLGNYKLHIAVIFLFYLPLIGFL